MADSYYQKLKNLVSAGRLSICLIVAPSRTSSSLVEHVIGNSSDIDNECHEPFLGARRDGFDPEEGYRQIYESAGGEFFENSSRKKSIVIKEMAHFIGKNDEYKKLAELVTGPIIALIRNPLLSVESRICRILVTTDMRCDKNLQQYLLNEVAVKKGFASWREFAKSTRSEPKDIELIKKEKGEQLYDSEDLPTYKEILNIFAREEGYKSWKELIERKLHSEHDYAFFAGVLALNMRKLNFDEFQKLEEEVGYFIDQDIKHIIVDTTDLRANPEEQIQQICSQMGIAFSDKMLHWEKKSVDFCTEQTKEHEKLWYGALFDSTCIKPPTEIPPTLKMFPGFIGQYLADYDLPVYARLSEKKIKVGGKEGEPNEQEFKVDVTEENFEQLSAAGVINGPEFLGQKVCLKLKRIDPVYAMTNNPTLSEDQEFSADIERYQTETKIVRDIISQEGEPTQEFKNRR